VGRGIAAWLSRVRHDRVTKLRIDHLIYLFGCSLHVLHVLHISWSSAACAPALVVRHAISSFSLRGASRPDVGESDGLGNGTLFISIDAIIVVCSNADGSG